MSYYLDHVGGPMNHPRYRAPYLAIRRVLSDGEWHPIAEVKAAAASNADLSPSSISNLIAWGHKRGQPAQWNYRGKGKTKQLRLTERTAP